MGLWNRAFPGWKKEEKREKPASEIVADLARSRATEPRKQVISVAGNTNIKEVNNADVKTGNNSVAIRVGSGGHVSMEYNGIKIVVDSK